MGICSFPMHGLPLCLWVILENSSLIAGTVITLSKNLSFSSICFKMSAQIFCDIQKRGFLTCIRCRILPSKVEFYQRFQVNSLLCFKVKHFFAAATELLATMSNLQLVQAKVFSYAQENVHLLSTTRYLICLKYNSNFVCNLSENCRLQLCPFSTSTHRKKRIRICFCDKF